MPLKNRVTPLGDLIADPARGLVYGNRGCLHDARGDIRRRFAGKRWIACRLRFKDWHRTPLLQPGRFTELFFLDEATAFAAGHRPCALCRHDDFARFTEIWSEIHPGQTGADAIDAQLHEERVEPSRRGRRVHEASIADLPDGTFVLLRDGPWLVRSHGFRRWTAAGYTEGRRRPASGTATVITPASVVEILRVAREPSVPFLHPSAD